MKRLPNIPEPPKNKRLVVGTPAQTPMYTLSQRIDELEKQFKLEIGELREELKAKTNTSDYSAMVKAFKTELEHTKAEISPYIEERMRQAIEYIKSASSRLEPKALEKVARKVPKNLFETDTMIQSLKGELAELRQELFSEIKQLREEGISKANAGQGDEEEAKLLSQRVSEMQSMLTQERAYIEESLKKLEARFSEELTKIIGWINYFKDRLGKA